MLRARRRGFFRREYEVTADDEPVTTLQGSRREGCTFELGGTAYRVERDGRKRFLLFGPDGRVATAERDTSREWTVRAQSGNLKLVKPSMWRSGWEFRQRGTTKGAIGHEGWLGRAHTAEVPEGVPLPVGLFAFYVVLVMAERAASAAAASG